MPPQWKLQRNLIKKIKSLKKSQRWSNLQRILRTPKWKSRTTLKNSKLRCQHQKRRTRAQIQKSQSNPNNKLLLRQTSQPPLSYPPVAKNHPKSNPLSHLKHTKLKKSRSHKKSPNKKQSTKQRSNPAPISPSQTRKNNPKRSRNREMRIQLHPHLSQNTNNKTTSSKARKRPARKSRKRSLSKKWRNK